MSEYIISIRDDADPDGWHRLTKPAKPLAHCCVIASVTEGLMSSNPLKWFELSCGHSFMVDGLDTPRCCPICIALINTDDDFNDNLTTESVVSNNRVDANDGNVAQADSREQLEADVRNQAEYSWVTAPFWKVIDWLDRQAAITERDELKSKLDECKGSLVETHAYCRYLQDKLLEYEKGQTNER